MTLTDQVFSIFISKGDASYFGERVSQLGHALQCADLAERAGAKDPLVVAALLHDFGHLVHLLPENIADEGVDTRHEEIGGAWLAQYFGPEVIEPVLLHVAAKRYFCAVDAEYFSLLSPASIQSLRLQGGPLSPEEVKTFETHTHFRDAVDLRRWDDAAKVPGLAVSDLEHYRSRIDAALAGQLRK
jgi:phosphonate degradation associated HDIG domain protein